MDKPTVVYPHHERALSHRKEKSADTPNNMGKLQMCYAKWKKPFSRGHILYNNIHLHDILEEAKKYKHSEQIWVHRVSTGAGWGGGGAQRNYTGAGNFLHAVCARDCKNLVYACVKIHQTLSQKSDFNCT